MNFTFFSVIFEVLVGWSAEIASRTTIHCLSGLAGSCPTFTWPNFTAFEVFQWLNQRFELQICTENSVSKIQAFDLDVVPKYNFFGFKSFEQLVLSAFYAWSWPWKSCLVARSYWKWKDLLICMKLLKESEDRVKEIAQLYSLRALRTWSSLRLWSLIGTPGWSFESHILRVFSRRRRRAGFFKDICYQVLKIQRLSRGTRCLKKTKTTAGAFNQTGEYYVYQLQILIDLVFRINIGTQKKMSDSTTTKLSIKGS